MALNAQPPNERKRVKVYELKNNDWYDRGTGFCSGSIQSPHTAPPEALDARIVVQSEEDPNNFLLETRITKDDGYQKQQDTLIVWTESNGVDMALSFQEPEGCASIWEFVSEVQGRLSALGPGDDLDDDLLDPTHALTLQDPQLGKLEDIEGAMRAASTTSPGRDVLAKFVMSPDQMYILKLAPLVAMAEDLEALADLHRLCNIMKTLILLNDTSIIEFVVTDQAIMGVVGALEYDPDFPSHKANHRQYLSDASKFKEVVKIDDENIRRKIHYTYRLLYLKDVVLARILDDPTFSVLNSLIFFHQVDIVNHIQQNQAFLQELFGIFSGEAEDESRKKEAVSFIKDTCAVSKTIQAQSRNQLYQNFIGHGLFDVLVYALRHHDNAVRVAGTDILVALIDHDPQMVRQHIYAAIKDKAVPLTDTLIELLLVEVDLGVKAQMADALKILLDPQSSNASLEMMNRNVSAEFVAKQRGGPNGHPHGSPQTEAFIQNFYDESAMRLFKPLKDLEYRASMQDLSVQETSLFTHLVEVLCFFVRQHSYKSKLFVLQEDVHCRVAQLLLCPQKYMKLTALKWFRTCIGLQDEFHNRQLIQHRLFEPILNIVFETMPRDNLLNSACLELFEYVKRESVKQLIVHLVEQYRERLMGITYVNTFQAIVLKYDQLQAGYLPANGIDESFTTQEGTPQRVVNGTRFSGLREQDADEEAYFNAEDDIDAEEELKAPGLPDGASPVRPLVPYADDEDDAMELLASSPDPLQKKSSSSDDQVASEDSEPPTADAMEEDVDEPHAEGERGRNRTPVPIDGSPGRQEQPQTPDSVPMKRRREEDEEDELSKVMSSGVKRRNSSMVSDDSLSVHAELPSNPTTTTPAAAAQLDGPTEREAPPSQNGQHHLNNHQEQQQQQHAPHGHALRRKGSLKTKNEGSGAKFAIKPISLSAVKAAGNEQHDGGGGG